jgi:hypothetical protein
MLRLLFRFICNLFQRNRPMNLSDAITAVEQAQSAYTAAASQTTNDQAAAAAIQAKLDGANALVATDQVAQTKAAQDFNVGLDALIQAATDAKLIA